jgi:hypothetical protein
VLLCPADVDEQSKQEIKAALLSYDRTLLVADPRRCEPKKWVALLLLYGMLDCWTAIHPTMRTCSVEQHAAALVAASWGTSRPGCSLQCTAQQQCFSMARCSRFSRLVPVVAMLTHCCFSAVQVRWSWCPRSLPEVLPLNGIRVDRLTSVYCCTYAGPYAHVTLHSPDLCLTVACGSIQLSMAK